MSFHIVNTNNASPGLRENVMLTNLAPKFDGKNMVPKYWMWGEVKSGRHPWQGHTYQRERGMAPYFSCQISAPNW